MNIDAATQADLRELRPLVANHIDAAITAAFKQILQFPPVQQIYRNISLEDAKQSQRQHWLDDVFAGSFTDAQLDRAIEMVERRQRAGLSVRWYFAFWTVIIVQLSDAVTRAYRRRPDQMTRMLASM